MQRATEGIRVLIAAGGTGGHLIPAQQLGELLKQQGYDVVFAGHKLASSGYFKRDKFSFFDIDSSAKFSRVWRLAVGVVQALRVLCAFRPQVVVGFGSFHTAPVLLASALLRKKIVLYEANRTVGKVNRYFVPAAVAIAHQWPLDDFESRKSVPVRRFPWVSKTWGRGEALARYGLLEGCFTVLVFGGSQGAQFLNERAPQLVQKMGAQALHLAGTEEGAKLAREGYAAANVRAVVQVFENDMAAAYAACDMALCRSGAGTVAELLRFAVPALLIPYPYATKDHQRENARYLAGLGGALWLAQSEASVEAMAKLICGADFAAMRAALRQAVLRDEACATLDALVSELCKKSIIS